LSVVFLSLNVAIIFQNIFYIPIIIACLYYRQRGLIFSIVIACIYFFLVLVLTPGMELLIEAGVRVLVFIVIAVVITYLSISRNRGLIDIAGLEQAENDLRESETKFRSVFEEAREGILLIDFETGTIVDCNPEFERQTGRRFEELKKMKIWDLRPPELVEANRALYNRIKENGGGISSEMGYQKPDETVVPIEFIAKKMRIQAKDYFLGMTHDITERKNAEATEQQLREKSELSSRMASIGEMAAGIAHEINNPLTGVIGFSDHCWRRICLPISTSSWRSSRRAATG
jgi:PAS domain S-box-containing protein